MTGSEGRAYGLGVSLGRLGIVSCFAIGLALAAPSSRAEAQGCSPGRVVAEQTEGRCCWPGQRWNAEAARCEGPPSCPRGWGAAGDDCLPIETADEASPEQGSAGEGTLDDGGVVDEGTAARGELGRPEIPPLEISPVPPPRMESHPDYGFIIAGSIVLGLAYVPSAVLGPLTGVWIGGLPVLGAWIWPIWDLTLGLIAGLPMAAVQTLGFVLLMVGLASWSEEPRELASIVPSVVGGPGDLGLGLRWRF